MNPSRALNELVSSKILEAESTKEIRKQIFLQIAQSGFESLDGKYGIRLLMKREDLPKDMDCTSYIFGNWKRAGGRLYKTVASSLLVATPEPFDLAIYGFSDDDEGIRHVGIVTPSFTVISKWQNGPVFEHPPEHVPMTYGPIEYRRFDYETILDHVHPSLHRFLMERVCDSLNES